MSYQGLLWGQVIQLVVVEGKRPDFEPHAPAAYKDLACKCWAKEPSTRPSFTSVVAHLEEMLTQPELVQLAAQTGTGAEPAPSLAHVQVKMQAQAQVQVQMHVQAQAQAPGQTGGAGGQGSSGKTPSGEIVVAESC